MVGPDLPALIGLAALNRSALALTRGWWRLPVSSRDPRPPRAAQHDGPGRRNISAHYDLGNDFYRLFLDETMTYSSAVFASPEQSLADAQRNKYRGLAEGAGLSGGEHVLEIGSGWGGFALYAAGELGCRVTTITISAEQHALAAERVREAGLEDLVDIQLRDYRDISGQYDAIVSIEMLEAVGAEYYTAYFEACDRALGRAAGWASRSITFPDVAYETQLRGAPTGSRPTSSRAACCRPWPSSNSRSTAAACWSPACGTSATLRAHAQAWRSASLRASTRCGPGLRRAVHPDVGVLPRALRGRLPTGLTQDLQIVIEKGRGVVSAGRLTG